MDPPNKLRTRIFLGNVIFPRLNMRNALPYYVGLLPPCWGLVLGEVLTACHDVHCYAQWQTEPLHATLLLLIGFPISPDSNL